MGVVEKVYLVFEEKLPEAISDGFCLLWEEGIHDSLKDDPNTHWYKSINMFHEIAGHPNILLGFISGEPAKLMVSKSVDEVRETIKTEVLHKIVEKFLRWKGSELKIPPLKEVIVSSWSSDPFVKGSYSYVSKECNSPKWARRKLGAPLMLNGRVKIAFAGEAMSVECYGTVHGAMMTAMEAAELVEDSILLE